MAPPRIGASAVPKACCALLGLVLLAHAGLVARARWQADEYLYFAMLRDQGAPFVADRLLHWSPRPWSELLLAGYGAAVNRLHRPLSGSVTALLWTAMALACAAPAWRGAARSDPDGRWLRLAVGLALFAATLLGHPVSEVFYWPAGSLAYMPTLTAACWLFWCLADGVAGSNRRWAAACLALAAGSSELGLFLTMIFCVLALAWQVRRGPAALAWLVPGLVVGAAGTLLLLRGRVGTTEIAGAGATLHHPLASLREALPQFGLDLVAGGQAGTPAVIVIRLAVLLLVFLGVRWCLLGRLRGLQAGALLPVLAASLLLAGFVSTAAALWQFGTPCCERHETMRQGYIVLAVFALAAWSAAGSRQPARAPALAPLPVLAAMLALFAWRVPALVQAYRAYPIAVRARTLTWQSGLQPGVGMTLVRMPDGALISSGEFDPPGVYVLAKDTPWYNRGVLAFFNKTTLVVRPAP